MSKVISLAAEISQFLQDLSKRETVNHPPPWSDFPYAEALLRWKSRGSHPMDFFSTDDQFFLHFREQLMERYGLLILSRNEALVREESLKVFRLPVSGFDN